MAQIICPGCGKQGLVGASFCRECGTALPASASGIHPASPPIAGSGFTLSPLALATLVLVATLIAGFYYLARHKEPSVDESLPAVAPDLAQEAPPESQADQPPIETKLDLSLDSAKLEGFNFSWRLQTETKAEGWFVIVGGVGEDAAEQPKLDAKVAAFKRCSGVTPDTGWSSDYQGMNAGYHIALFGGFADKDFAERAVKWAKKCVPDAYLRHGMRVEKK